MTNYTWYKDDEEEEEEPGSSLNLGAVDPSHSGLYRCKARNDLGEDQSAAIQLDIQCELIFHMFLTRDSVSVWTVDSDLSLSCVTKHQSPFYVSSSATQSLVPRVCCCGFCSVLY